MSRPEIILWDVDGTLAETERDGHRVAFNRAFEACGLPWRWDERQYGELLEVAGGRERLEHFMAGRADVPDYPGGAAALAREVHRRKNEFYAGLVREGRIEIREGVLPLLGECRGQGRRIGITTTTSRANIDALLTSQLGAGWSDWIGVVVSGDDVRRKKPDPEVYERALEIAGVTPGEAVAIEDSPDGVAAAQAAGVPVIVTRSFYFADAPIAGALAIGPGLHARHGWQPALPPDDGSGGRVRLADVDRWFDAEREVAGSDRAGPLSPGS